VIFPMSAAPPLRLPENGPGSVLRLLQEPWKRYRKGLKRCRRKCSPAAIHDFRIQIRRLLSSLELLGGLLPPRRVEKLHRVLKRRLDLFDDLRDTQVQLQTLTRMRHAFPVARMLRSALLEREERFTRRVRKQLKQIDAGRVRELIGECRERLEKRLEELSPRKLSATLLRPVERGFRRASRLRARIRAEDAQTIHHTRVAFKHFRYMVEALAKAVPCATEEHLAALHRYQTMMGNIQDSVVLLGALDEFLRKQPVISEAMRRFRQQLLRRRQRLIHVYLRAADELSTFWPLPACKKN